MKKKLNTDLDKSLEERKKMQDAEPKDIFIAEEEILEMDSNPSKMDDSDGTYTMGEIAVEGIEVESIDEKQDLRKIATLQEEMASVWIETDDDGYDDPALAPDDDDDDEYDLDNDEYDPYSEDDDDTY